MQPMRHELMITDLRVKRTRRGPRLATAAITLAMLAMPVLASAQGAGSHPRPAGGSTQGAKPIPHPDADMQMVLDALAGLMPKPIPTLTAEEARRQPSFADALKRVAAQQGHDTTQAGMVPGVRSEDRAIEGPAGPIPVRVYTPANAPARGAGLPIIVYYHGGGWVIATVDTYDASARTLAKRTGAVVVAVEYRKAPEAKFPAQQDDALASYRYVTQHARDFGGDGRRFALAGESAGGGLVISTVVAARDAHLPMPRHVLSVYPIAQGDTTTPSYLENANALPLSRGAMSWFLEKTTRTPADRRDPRLDVTRANLRGLPPVTIINDQIDPLRDDGLLLERALRAAGVPVERRVYDGVTHEFFGMGVVVHKADEAEQYATQRLRQAFGK